jgi:hypothetical protein
MPSVVILPMTIWHLFMLVHLVVMPGVQILNKRVVKIAESKE